MNRLEPIRFGKYQLLEKIASGGMAELYRAMITGTQGFEKLVAIKKILSHLTDEKNLVNSFIEEAKLAALLQHQNIVQIYDFGTIEGDYFIAMEHLSGKDLRLLLKKCKEKETLLTLEYALYITARLCEGLDYAHSREDFQGNPLNIIHRDISPPNVFITYDGEVKILDFGIAKAASQNTTTVEGVIKGKVAYMSPEQAGGESIDQRSDIFSTGVLLYEMVTGRQMFEGDPIQVLHKVRDVEFERAEEVVKDLPPRLYEILHRALDKYPDQRYQSNGEMLSELEEFVQQNALRPTARGLARYMKKLFEEEIAAETEGLRETTQIRLIAEAPANMDTESLKEEKEDKDGLQPTRRLRIRNRRKKFYGGMALAALVVLVILLAFWNNGESPPRPEKRVSKEPPGKDVLSESTESVSKALPQKAQEMAKLEEGLLALKRRQFALAAGLFEGIWAREPGMREKVSVPYAKALVGQAAGLVDKEPQEAKPLLLKAVELDPASVQAHFQLGLLYMRSKDYAKATGAYQKVAKLDPKFPEAYFNLAYIYAVTEDYTRAEEMYGRVVKLAPSYLDEVLFNLAMVQERQGKRAESIKNLEKALQVNPNNETAKRFLTKLKGQ